MTGRYNDTLSLRRFLRWLEANQVGIAWGTLAMLSALMTTIAWRLLLA